MNILPGGHLTILDPKNRAENLRKYGKPFPMQCAEPLPAEMKYGDLVLAQTAKGIYLTGKDGGTQLFIVAPVHRRNR